MSEENIHKYLNMFKDKTAKKRVYNNKEISTLDAMHNKIINLYSSKIAEEKNNLNRIKNLEDIHNLLNYQIINYNKVCSIPNSMTVLPELLPIMIKMMESKKVGTINLTNPGLISHNEILEMYKEIVDPKFTWKNFTIEEQNKILLSKRSNNQLNTSKLQKWYPEVLSIKESIRNCLQDMNKNNYIKNHNGGGCIIN